MQYIWRSTHHLTLLLTVALFFLSACNKNDSNPDLTYRVSYSVSTSGSVQVQQIFIKNNLGFTDQINGQNNFVQGYRFPPGETVSIRVVGIVIDGTVQVRLRATNPENEIDKLEPFSASGDSPTSFEIFLEAELE